MVLDDLDCSADDLTSLTRELPHCVVVVAGLLRSLAWAGTAEWGQDLAESLPGGSPGAVTELVAAGLLSPPPAPRYGITINGNVSHSQFGTGDHVEQRMDSPVSRAGTDTETAALQEAIAALRAELAAALPDQRHTEADELLDDLRAAVTAGAATDGIAARLRRWIALHAPALLTGVDTVLVPAVVRAAAALATGAGKPPRPAGWSRATTRSAPGRRPGTNDVQKGTY